MGYKKSCSPICQIAFSGNVTLSRVLVKNAIYFLHPNNNNIFIYNVIYYILLYIELLNSLYI